VWEEKQRWRGLRFGFQLGTPRGGKKTSADRSGGHGKLGAVARGRTKNFGGEKYKKSGARDPPVAGDH